MIRARQLATCLWFVILPLTPAAEEPLESVSIGETYIRVTAKQREKIDSIQERYESDIEAKLDSTAEISEAARKLELQMIGEMEAILTPAQLEELRKIRQARYLEKREEDAKFLQEFAAAAQSIAEASSIVVYEGLPRPHAADIELIKSKSKTIEVEKHDFYAERLDLSSAKQLAWRELLSDYRNFRPYGGGKLCGGFHPDLLVEFKGKAGMLRVLICFGCHEVAFVRSKGSLMVDMENKGFEQLLRAAKAIYRERNTR